MQICIIYDPHVRAVNYTLRPATKLVSVSNSQRYEGDESVNWKITITTLYEFYTPMRATNLADVTLLYLIAITILF
jgi:hypothetical protein